jgi:succinate dehydrogenase/fumarate reductase-like Fe-S protein
MSSFSCEQAFCGALGLLVNNVTVVGALSYKTTKHITGYIRDYVMSQEYFFQALNKMFYVARL